MWEKKIKNWQERERQKPTDEKRFDIACKINSFINNGWTYVSDPKGRDYWLTSDEALLRMTGDCEDAAAAKAGLLWDIYGFGQDEIAMGITWVKNPRFRASVGHMVVLYFDGGDSPYVLDNGSVSWSVHRASELAYGLRIERAFNRERSWVLGGM